MTLPDGPEQPDDDEEEPTVDPADYPGVETAFELIMPSYQLVEARLQSVNTWIQNMQVFAATLTVGAAAIAAGIVDDISFSSWSFILAMVAFVATVVIGTVARAYGSVQLINPNKLFDLYLRKDVWTFKKDLLASAGDDFDANSKVVNCKGYAATAMTVLVLVETALLVGWIVMER